MNKPLDQKTFFNALGFLAVVLNDVPQEKQAQRALAISKLIENFCILSVGEEWTAESSSQNGLEVMTQLFAGLVKDSPEKFVTVRDSLFISE